MNANLLNLAVALLKSLATENPVLFFCILAVRLVAVVAENADKLARLVEAMAKPTKIGRRRP